MIGANTFYIYGGGGGGGGGVKNKEIDKHSPLLVHSATDNGLVG